MTNFKRENDIKELIKKAKKEEKKNAEFLYQLGLRFKNGDGVRIVARHTNTSLNLLVWDIFKGKSKQHFKDPVTIKEMITMADSAGAQEWWQHVEISYKTDETKVGKDVIKVLKKAKASLTENISKIKKTLKLKVGLSVFSVYRFFCDKVI